MTVHTVYFAGGHDDDHPSQGRAEEWDLGSGTYTSWTTDGVVASTRPITEEERASLTPGPDLLAEAETALAKATTVAALRSAVLNVVDALDEP